MIYYTGDIHGQKHEIVNLVERFNLTSNDTRAIKRLKLEETPEKRKGYKPKPYQMAEYPGQKVQIDVKFVPGYCDLFRRFIDYNLENKAVYNDDDNKYISIIEQLHKECVEHNKVFFDFLSDYELSDTSRNVLSKVLSSIENSKQYIKGRTFTLIDYKDAVYTGNGYTVTVEHDNRFVDYEKKTWRMSQSKSYLEFLVMKTDDHKSSLVHYKDMIAALDRNDANEDRINLTSRILAKINIQFDSKRFAADGIKRTDTLVDEITNYDFAQAVAMPSNYCTYCRYNSVCLGK